MNINSIRTVLVETSHPGNIGSTARAMKTMGLRSLTLVNPKRFPDPKALELASGADDILIQATVTNTLEEAIADCQLLFATSVRPRDIDLPVVTPREAADLIRQQHDENQVGILFGREHAGLTNDELLHAQYRIHIPTHHDYSSLNLAQAVQIVAYELYMALGEDVSIVTDNVQQYLAPAEEVGLFFEHLRHVLVDIAFLKPPNTKKLFQRIQRLFMRAKLETTDINILRGILTQVERAIAKNSDNHD